MKISPMYFGCNAKRGVGHHLHDDSMRMLSGEFYTLGRILRYPIDGGYCPKNSKECYKAKVTYERGITILAFWENTVDKRPGSHSTFFLPESVQKEHVIGTAKEAFPEVWKRFTDVRIEIVEEETVTVGS